MSVIDLPVVTSLPSFVSRTLAKATAEKLSEVVVIGRREDGSLYFNSSTPDGGDVLWLMELAKKHLLSE